MAMLTWKQTVLNHIKNLVIRMGDCYMVIYFDDKSTLTVDPNNKIKGLLSKKVDVSNDDEDNDEEEELFK
jgi:hypothetical protein